ncbi:hypothetical protein DFP90_101677 [Aestuariispira insulae]|uniref:Uncharacterized protein n=1 Tax=Aestuariispira insulae TaxID=1461337 RepID=A0A3D9HWJ7_9PROT|nr:hypothetical protein DFP90_101677 [Aestuariispira insulae]
MTENDQGMLEIDQTEPAMQGLHHYRQNPCKNHRSWRKNKNYLMI